MTVNVISDVHFAVEATRRVVAEGKPLVILGDLVNLVDYRTADGAVADVLGEDFARESGGARGRGDYPAMRSLWAEKVGNRMEEVRDGIGRALRAQYEVMEGALAGGHGFVIHGNVDRPAMMVEHLPAGFEYVHGETRVIQELVFGFVGGGMKTPINVEGEVSDEEMARLLGELGPVDILCTHVPPAITALRTDVITGRAERGSEPIREYLEIQQPRMHLFGDVHQPKASRWRIGRTVCRNAGYFRATGRPVVVDPAQLR